MHEYLGWIGSFLFASCGFPAALQSYKEGHSKGMGWSFLLMWFGGEVCTILYILPKQDIPLLLNYAFNFAFLCVIIWFKIFPRKQPIQLFFTERQL